MSFFSTPPATANSSNTGGNIFGSLTANSTGSKNSAPSAFGTPAGGSVFGGGAASNATGTNIFGNASSSGAPASTGGGLFGANTPSSTSTPAAPADSLFGAAATNAPKPTGGLFSGATISNPGAGGNLFGGASTPAVSTTGNLFAGGGTSATPSGGLFGGGTATNTATGATPTTNTNPLFGGASAFSLPKPGETTASTAKPAGTSFFSQPSTAPNGPSATGATGAASTAPAPLTGSTLFGLPTKPSTTPATTTPATQNLFGGGLFGQGGSSSTTQPTTAATSTTAAPGTGLFGTASAAKDKDAEKKDGDKKDAAPAGNGCSSCDFFTIDSSSQATPATGFNIFGSKPAEKKDDNAAPKNVDKKDAAAPATCITTSATSATIAVPPPSMLRGKSLEEIINRWTADLEHNIREFNKFAAEVSIWDRALIENGNNIAALFHHVQAAERQQNNINEALDHIEQQQKDLGSTLDAYEKASQDILGGQSGSLRSLDTGPADNERDKNYMLATDLHTHLDDLSGSLTQMISSVNSLSISSKPVNSADDPMSQIAQILSSHLESLQWIDGAVREVESKTMDVEKRMKESGHSVSGTGVKSRGFGVNR
ncbi:hypothetical protein BDN70DRAFT_918003 [Pholiota conissans]|uniref:Nucleoporin NSP1 n=1 Tax=Pholiota conissans TaxID=109636 RepID=A0A9P5ZDH7_9AGAR|nr:hypothetical protein BDN70DRAFT_918003 [Pholiota conissans]